MFSKKTLIIIIGAAIIVIIAVVIGVYFAIKKTQEETQIETETPAVEVEAPITTPLKPRLSVVSDYPALAYWTIGDTVSSISSQMAGTSTQTIVSLEKQILYFNQKGQIVSVKNGKNETISDRQISDIQSVKPSEDGSLVAVKYLLLNSPQFEIFNIAAKVWQILDNITAVDFSPDGSQIAYLENVKNLTASDLIIKDLLGKQKATKILTINQKDFNLEWLTTDKIFLVSKPSANYQNEIWLVDVKKKTLNLFSRSVGLAVNWAKDASYGLKFSADQKGEGKLALIDKEAVVKANLNFSTLPEKCAVQINKIYCAVSYGRTSIKAPFLPDDYLKKAVYFSDFIYEIDISGNNLTTIFNETEPILDAFNLSLFEDKILFINKYDNKLYSLTL